MLTSQASFGVLVEFSMFFQFSSPKQLQNELYFLHNIIPFPESNANAIFFNTALQILWLIWIAAIHLQKGKSSQ